MTHRSSDESIALEQARWLRQAHAERAASVSDAELRERVNDEMRAAQVWDDVVAFRAHRR